MNIIRTAAYIAVVGLSVVQACRDDEWECPFTKKCINDFSVCDTYNNCGDWSDEIDWETGKCPPCPASRFQCPGTGRCIHPSAVCNGDNNCENWSDEREEDCPCAENQVRCPTVPGTIEPLPPRPCVLPEYFCDPEGIWDCPDGSDEANCTGIRK